MAGSVGPSALWYLTRGTGAVALVLLTVSVALGVANVRRVQTERAPRFVFDAVHRSASLLALAFLAVHIVTSVLDPFAPIRLIDAVVPFVSAYRPVWLGLGAIASDLLIAVALTSVLRRRFGQRAWRATHWLAYACWPVALVHGLGTGSDAKTTWMLALTAGSVLVVLAAVALRTAAGWPDHIGTRISAVVASVAAPIALLFWLPTGPLSTGWAKRAGTPSSLVRAATTVSASTTSTAGPSATPGTGNAAPAASGATVTGTVGESQLGHGLVQVNLRLSLAGQQLNALDIRIDGQPLGGGGVAMTSSTVTLGPSAKPAQYRGRITALEGTTIQARVSDTRRSLVLLAQLQINPSSGSVTGTLTSQSVATREPTVAASAPSTPSTKPASPSPKPVPPPPSHPRLLAGALGSSSTAFVPAVSWRGQPAVSVARSASGVALLSLDQRLVELRLHSGTIDAGGSGWRFGPAVLGSELGRLVAAFNGGFKFSTGAGGFESYGRVGAPLGNGLGSIVTYTDGRTDIGAWNQGVPAAGTPVASVRQNLTLLIDNGTAAANVDCISCWGATLGGVTDPARSALGITADGRLVWAGGEHLTPSELADALLGARVVRAVELDINPEWVAGYLYGHPWDGRRRLTAAPRGGVGSPAPVPVVPGQNGVPGFFLSPYSRDFFTVQAR